MKQLLDVYWLVLSVRSLSPVWLRTRLEKDNIITEIPRISHLLQPNNPLMGGKTSHPGMLKMQIGLILWLPLQLLGIVILPANLAQLLSCFSCFCSAVCSHKTLITCLGNVGGMQSGFLSGNSMFILQKLGRIDPSFMFIRRDFNQLWLWWAESRLLIELHSALMD